MPFTAIAGTPFTAAQYNSNIRDNLVETETSRAQTATGYCVTTGMNQLAERIPLSSLVTTTDTTTSAGTYVDLDNTPGPSVTVVTGTSAFVSIYGSLQNSSSTAAWIGFGVTGATELDPADSYAIEMQISTPGERVGATFFRSDLNPGSNTFTCKYRVSTSGTGTFAARRIAVFPF